MKAVITVLGNDRIGILAKMANICADHQINILDVDQTIVDNLFTMTMIVDTEKMEMTLADFAIEMDEEGKRSGLVSKVMHRDIFDSMHRI